MPQLDFCRKILALDSCEKTPVEGIPTQFLRQHLGASSEHPKGLPPFFATRVLLSRRQPRAG